jgi:hypothetical protein
MGMGTGGIPTTDNIPETTEIVGFPTDNIPETTEKLGCPTDNIPETTGYIEKIDCRLDTRVFQLSRVYCRGNSVCSCMFNSSKVYFSILSKI